MTLPPLYSRVDGAIQANICLGDLVLADNPDALASAHWVRVEKWQTTLDGDICIWGKVDQPTETCSDGMAHGSPMQVLASRVVKQIPAGNVTDVRLENFFADTTRDPSPEFTAAFNNKPGPNTYVFNETGELIEAVRFLGIDDGIPLFSDRPDWIDVALRNHTLNIATSQTFDDPLGFSAKFMVGRMALGTGDWLTRKASGTIMPFPCQNFDDHFTRFTVPEAVPPSPEEVMPEIEVLLNVLRQSLEALTKGIDDLGAQIDAMGRKLNAMLDDGK